MPPAPTDLCLILTDPLRFSIQVGEKLSVRLLPLAFGGEGRSGSSESAIIILSPVAMDEMFELFDNELLITDNAFHHVPNRNYTN